MKEGDRVAILTEVTAVHPEWVAVKVQFGRLVQNIRVDKELVQVVEPEEPKAAKRPRAS